MEKKIKYFKRIPIQNMSFFMDEYNSIFYDIYLAIMYGHGIIKIINITNDDSLPKMNAYPTIYEMHKFVAKYSRIRYLELNRSRTIVQREWCTLSSDDEEIDFMFDYSFLYNNTIPSLVDKKFLLKNGSISTIYISSDFGISDSIEYSSRDKYLSSRYIFPNNVHAQYEYTEEYDAYNNISAYNLYRRVKEYEKNHIILSP